jgi:hypothetical protein
VKGEKGKREEGRGCLGCLGVWVVWVRREQVVSREEGRGKVKSKSER